MGSSSSNKQPTGSESSGGGSSSSTSTNVQNPFQQDYFKQQLINADKLFQQGGPKYYEGETVAGFTPAQMESMNLTSNWVTGNAQDMMGNTNNQWQQMMSGQNNMGSDFAGLGGQFNNTMGDMMSGQVNTGAGSPYGDMADAFTSQAVDQANSAMQGIRGNQVMSGQYGGSGRGDMLNNQVINETNKQVTNNLAGMYGNAYSQAQDQRAGAAGMYGQAQVGSMDRAAQTQAQALGQYGNIMNMPLEMSKSLYNNVGLPQQQMNQGLMNDQKQRWDYNQMLPYKNLEMFANFINGNMGGTSTTNTNSNSSSSSSTTPTYG